MPSQAVNRPTDVKQREKDVNNKLQWYGIYTAFANGKVPSNKQIDIALNSALASKALSSPSKDLSPDGQKVIADLKDVIEKAKILVLTKNEGNLLQDFIWQTQQVSIGDKAAPNVPVEKTTAQRDANEALEGLRTLGTLIVSNGQFRKLLNDATILLRDIAGDAAQKAAHQVRPSQDQLDQIDHLAEDNTWHDVPDLSRDKLRSQLRQKYDEQKPFGRGEVQKVAGDATQAAHPAGSRDPADAADLAARDQQYDNSSGVDAQQGARAGVDQLRDQARQNVPEETQDRARDIRERTKRYFLDDKLNKDRRDRTIFRLKKMVVEIQGHQDYLRAVETLLRLAEKYTGHTKDVVSQGHGAVKGAHADDSLQIAEADLKTLIERFANSTSLDDLFDSINNIYRDADRDPELKDWFKHIDRYIRRCLKEQGFIMEDEATDEWNAIYDQGHFLLRDRYRNHTNRIVDELRFLVGQFDEDPQNKAFGEALRKLFLDLGQDDSGQAALKPHLIKDLTDVIIPGIFENTRYVPVPRIEYTDSMVDVIIENLIIESDNLAPNVLEFGADNYWRWGRKKISNKNRHKFMLSVSGVQMDLRDVSYYIKRKQGFPSITDKGVMDVFLGGQGLSFKVQMEKADKDDKAHLFKITKVDVELKNLNIKLKTSTQKFLFTLLKPLLFKFIRPALQKVLEKQIKENIMQLDALAYQVQQEVNQAKADAKRNPDPANIQNIYQRYVSAINKQIMQGKRKAEEITSDKQVNVAVTQHDSIFPTLDLPGGISTKATEYKELAAKGDKWESPVFSIGSAKETTNLPKIPSVTRKPHNVNRGGVRGDNTSGEHSAGRETGYGRSNGNTGFGNQVDHAFEGNTQDYGLSGGSMNGNTKHNTTFGDQNPVLTGST